MKVAASNCPKCQAPLVEHSRFCSHCGTPVVLDDESAKLKYTYQKVDDARIREADAMEKIRLKELEIEWLKLRDESRQKNAALWMKMSVLIGFLLVLGLLLSAVIFSPEPDTKFSGFLLAVILMIVMGIVFSKAFRKS